MEDNEYLEKKKELSAEYNLKMSKLNRQYALDSTKMNEIRIINGIKYIRVYSVVHDPKIKVWIKSDSEDAKVITKKKCW